VDSSGAHGLSCRRSAGRQLRHALLNDILHRAFVKAGVPAVKEPTGLSHGDEKRPDGCTLIPWADGRCLAWDVTVPDTLAPSHIQASSRSAGAAAEASDRAKHLKYSHLVRSHCLTVVAVETLGPFNREGALLISNLGRKLSISSGDPRETSFLFQRLSVAVQRGNAVSFAGSFCDLGTRSGSL
jgi:hypothetical protein